MKSFAIVSVALLVVLAFCACSSEAVVADWVKMINRPKLIQCAADEKISQTDLQNLIDNHLENDSTGMQCTTLCYFKVIGMMDDGGNLDAVSATLRMSLGECPLKVASVVHKCKDIKGANPCNQAWLINKCFVDNDLL